jgi:flagellar biosynthesis component FlhA
VNKQGELPAYFLPLSLEQAVESSIQHGELNSVMTMAPEGIRDILARIGRKVESLESAVVISSSGARHFLRQVVEATFPNLTVLAHNEILPQIKVKLRGVIE